MPDLHVVAVIIAKPGSEEPVRDALTDLVVATRAEEGCLEYTLSVSAADPTVFITQERWRSQADLDTHMTTEHIRTALTVTAPHLASPPAIYPLVPVS